MASQTSALDSTASFELKSVSERALDTDGVSTRPTLSRAPSYDDDAARVINAPDGGLRAWLVLCGAFVLTFFYGGYTYSFGIFQAAFEKRDLASTPILVILGSIPVFFLAITAIPANIFVQWLGNRQAAMLGGFLVGLSQLLAGFCIDSLVGLFLLFGPVQGAGSALVYLSTVPLLSQYFEKRRGLATGICYSAAGLGGAFFSIVSQALISEFDLKWAYHVNGLIAIAICLPVGAFMKPLEGRRPPISQRRILNAAVFGSIPFVFICVASAIIAFTLFTPSFFLVSYTGTLGFSDSVAAQLNMGYNLSSAAGRVIFGALADYFLGDMNALVLAVILSGVSCLTIWPLATTLPPLATFAVISGMTSGAWFALIPGVCAALLGNWLVGAGLAWQELFGSAGYLLGGPVAGFILDAAGGLARGAKALRPAMFYSGSATVNKHALFILAAILILVARLLFSTKMRRI